MMAKAAAGIVLAGLLIVTATETSIAQQDRFIAKACITGDEYDLLLCRAYIASLRVFLQGKDFCSPVPDDDPSDIDAVIKWIRAHPERQHEDLYSVTVEVLKKLHPCR